MNTQEYPNSAQFLGGYFHQDFSKEFATSEQALERFIQESNDDMRALIVNELQVILEKHQDGALEKIILELGCYYSPKSIKAFPCGIG